MKKFIHCILFFVSFVFVSPDTFSKSIGDSIFIGRGTVLSADSVDLPLLLLNNSNLFGARPYIIHCSPGDTLNIAFVNNDSTAHNLNLSNKPLETWMANKYDTIQKQLIFNQGGVHAIKPVPGKDYYDGLFGLIVVDEVDSSDKNFYWILREYDTAWLNSPSLNYGDSLHYNPQYFTINNLSFPRVQNDSLAFIHANVGDTVNLYIYNAGLMSHNLHFHGYHATIKMSSKNPGYAGREKDSLPIDINESLKLTFVPKQPGEFPVHNHNLGATLGNNVYPNGMVVFIKIDE